VCRRRAGAGAGGGRRSGRFRVGSPAPPSLSPFSPPLKGQALRVPGGKREGPSWPARHGHAPDRGHSSQASGGLLGLGPGGRRRELELPAPRSPPRRGVPEAPLPRSGVGRSLVTWSLPLLPPPSGFRGLRDRGAGLRDRSPFHRPVAGLGLMPSRSVSGRGNFPKPEIQPEHPPKPPRPLIVLPLHLLQRRPLPPTRILQCLTDGTVSQSKAGN
jgi:hypothetical protein